MNEQAKSILEWIDIGKVSAERDDLLTEYFFDNGVVNNVIGNKNSFLVLGRKGAGKTAVFKFLSENQENFIQENELLTALSFDDYSWNIHALLVDSSKAESLAYRRSWNLIILIEAIRAHANWFARKGERPPKSLEKANKLLEKIFESPVPSISTLIGRKILSLSGLKLPKGGFNLEDGSVDEVSLDGSEVSFETVRDSSTLQSRLSESIENLIKILEKSLIESKEQLPTLFICFDKVDEAWDEVSFDSSKKVIAGLVAACDSITAYHGGSLRPIIFLREDIFETLSLNDSNKLRADCGELLNWTKSSLVNLILRRINYFAKTAGQSAITNFDQLFDRPEMRQRLKPFNYILKRTMMRPRDLISIMGMVVKTMKEQSDSPFADETVYYDKLEAEAIYAAEPKYSEWLRQEIMDEWKVQRPEIVQIFNALQNNGATNFGKEAFTNELENLDYKPLPGEVLSLLRFMFDNSIIGFKIGSSNEWKFKCFYPTQGFLDSEEYRVHEGLVRALNLKENREREA